MKMQSSTTQRPWILIHPMPSIIATEAWHTCAQSAMAMPWQMQRRPWTLTKTTLRDITAAPPQTWHWASSRLHLRTMKQ